MKPMPSAIATSIRTSRAGLFMLGTSGVEEPDKLVIVLEQRVHVEDLVR